MKTTTSIFRFLIQLAYVQAACYTHSGLDRNDLTASHPQTDVYLPCNSSAKASMCCAIGGSDAASNDICQARGLCYNPQSDTYYRESCTDQTWQDPACVKLFVNVSSDIEITKCNDGTWCYGKGPSSSECCTEGEGVSIEGDGTQTNQRPNSTLSTTPATNSSEIDASGHGSSSTSLSKSGKIGLGVGLGIGLPLIAVCIYFRRAAMRFRSRRSKLGPQPLRPEHNVNAEKYQAQFGRAELSAHSRKAGNKVYERVELPANSSHERIELKT